MGHAFTMRGADAWITWGYQRAARVTAWTVTTADDGLALTGTVSEVNSFRVSQVPLVFRVARSHGSAWLWPIRTLHIADGSLTATLEPQKGSN